MSCKERRARSNLVRELVADLLYRDVRGAVAEYLVDRRLGHLRCGTRVLDPRPAIGSGQERVVPPHLEWCRDRGRTDRGRMFVVVIVYVITLMYLELLKFNHVKHLLAELFHF